MFGLAVCQMLRYQQQGNALEELAISGLIVLYVGGCASFWVILRAQSSSQWALLTLVGIIAVTKLADIGAYLTGKSIGRTKLCPKISPGKTVEGLCGGLLFSAVGSWGYFNYFVPWLQTTEASRLGQFGPLVLAILLTFGGLVGDLTESLIKRDVGSKDSGNLLPGMGGIWDVTDSLLPAAVLGFLGVVARLVPQSV
jgi:phosphatidate cytidylyltransferase